jgi:hypothetical protein
MFDYMSKTEIGSYIISTSSSVNNAFLLSVTK